MVHVCDLMNEVFEVMKWIGWCWSEWNEMEVRKWLKDREMIDLWVWGNFMKRSGGNWWFW